MRNEVKIPREAKASLAYVLSSLLVQGMSIFTLPLFSRMMSTAEMGYVTTYNTWNSILFAVATLSLGSGTFNVALLEYEKERDAYQSSILTLSTVSALVFSGVFVLLYPSLRDMINIMPAVVPVMLAGFTLQPALNFWISRQRFELRYQASSLVSVATSVLGSLAAVAAVYFAREQGTQSLSSVRIIAMSSVVLVFSLVIYIQTMHRGRTFVRKSYWGFALRLSVPMIFHTLSKHILDASDKLMIGSMIGQREVGIYGVLVSISSLGGVVWMAINASLVPFMFSKMNTYSVDKQRESRDEINRVIMPLLVAYAVACLLLCLAAPEIVAMLTTKDYSSAVSLMPPIAAGIFFQSLYNIYANVLMYKKKTNLVMWATIIAALFNVVTNYFLIPLFGYVAAAYTTFASYVLLAAMQFRFGMDIQSKKSIINNRVWAVSALLSMMCIGVIPLYPIPIVRYLLVAVLLTMIFIRRKWIYTAVFASRNDKDVSNPQ